MTRIRIIHWNEENGQAHAARLREAGYQAEFEVFSSDSLKAIRQDPPAAIIIDLTRSPSQGRDLGLAFRKYKDTRSVPIVFVEGSPDKVDKIRKLLPDATFSNWGSIEDTIQIAIDNPPIDPIVPDSIFAGYCGTPLPKKLGIKVGYKVILINAPRDFADTLGKLPEDAVMHQGIGDGDLSLWFTQSLSDLQTQIKLMSKLTQNGPLWIIWPKKSSKLAGDLTQNIVRRTALDNGLVDYKVCSVDDTWSGLCFTYRK